MKIKNISLAIAAVATISTQSFAQDATYNYDVSAMDLPFADRASDEAVEILADYFETKTAQDVDGTVDFFEREGFTYFDATLGWDISGYEVLHEIFTTYMPNWANGGSYPTFIWGDVVDGEGSLVVAFTDTPELFGGELRILGAIDVRGGKIVRWTDYWDATLYGDDLYAQLRVPAESFPTIFGEEKIESVAPAALTETTKALHAALSSGDAAAAAALFDADATFENKSTRVVYHGPAEIEGYLASVLEFVPFGKGAELRHIVGGAQGGGYEWTAANGLVGITAIATAENGAIQKLVTVYDSRQLN